MRPTTCLLALAPAFALAGESILDPAEISEPLAEVAPFPEFAPTDTATGPVTNNFHLYDINEVYTNADGSVQFIELYTTSTGQQVLDPHTITLQLLASPFTTQSTFGFPGDGPSPTGGTTHQHLLIGTANLTTLYGVTPDFVLTANFLNVTNGFSNRRLNFGENTDIVNLNMLPTDGIASLDALRGNTSVTAFQVNTFATPTNWANVTATIPEPGTGALLLTGLLLSQRRRR